MRRPRRCFTMMRAACTLVSQAASMVAAVSRQMPALNSQNGLDHSAMVAPQAESTMRSSRPGSSSTRRNKVAASSSLPRSARTGMPWPPRAQTSSAVSSTVPGAPSAGLGPWREGRAATYTGAPASPSASAMPLPAPRLDPATTAIFPCKGFRLLSILLLLQVHRRVTARDLAQRLEVSERTLLRDMNAPSGAGVPVVAGAGGGRRLELARRLSNEAHRAERGRDSIAVSGEAPAANGGSGVEA